MPQKSPCSVNLPCQSLKIKVENAMALHLWKLNAIVKMLWLESQAKPWMWKLEHCTPFVELINQDFKCIPQAMDYV
jgi:hypothetical protein